MKREWLIWKTRNVMWICLVAAFVLGYLGFLGYEEYDSWIPKKELSESYHYSTPELTERANDILWQTMVGNMVNKPLDYLIPVVFVCVSFGVDIYKKRMEKMRMVGMKLSYGYFRPFLSALFLAGLAVVLGFGMQIFRLHMVWEGYLSFEDLGFVLRVFLYELLVVFCLTSVAQLACCLFSKTHIILAAAGSYLLFIAATYPGKILADTLAGSNGEYGGYQILTYFFHDVNQQEVQVQYAPVVQDSAAAALWGETMIANYLIIGAICLAAGYLIYSSSYRRKTA